MQANEMNIQPSETPIEQGNQAVDGNNIITLTVAELEDLTQIPGIDTVTFTPDQWNYFVEELQTKAPIEAVRRAKILAKTVNPPRQFETPQYPYIPCGDKSPGIDTVDLTPEEWKYFVEEVKTKTPFSAFNNAKYLADMDRSFAAYRAGKFVEHELIEVDDDEQALG